MIILTIIYNEIQQISYVRNFIDNGKSMNYIIETLKISSFRAKKLMENAKKKDFESLTKILKMCFELDLQIKTGKIKDKLALEIILAKI